AEYAHAILSNAIADATDAVMSRLERQRALLDKSKSLNYLMPESALRAKVLNPEGMRVQYNHLISLTTLANVRIGIIPASAATTLCPSTFLIYDQELVAMDTPIGTFHSWNATEVEICRTLFADMSELALWGEEARAFLRGLESELEHHEAC